MRSVALGFVLLGLACSHGDRRGTPRDRGAVVAHIAGEPVYTDEVAAVMRLEGVTAREALDAIVRERILAREALATGVATDDDVSDAAWRGRLQLLLTREVEEAHTQATIPPNFFDELYRHRRVALHHDGLVRVVHALAPQETTPGRPQVPTEQLRARAASFLARLRAEPSLPSRERFEALARSAQGIRFEEIPPFDQTGQSEDGTRFAEPFVRAAWALSPQSPLSELVTTPFGVHVILRVGDVPPRTLAPAEVREVILREGITLRRARALGALLERLRAAADVRVSETAIAATVATGRR